MNKETLIKKVAQKGEISEIDSMIAIETALDIITETLEAGEKVSLVGFGIFEIHDRKARGGKNPRTGEDINITASKLPVFRASKNLKDKMNKNRQRVIE